MDTVTTFKIALDDALEYEREYKHGATLADCIQHALDVAGLGYTLVDASRTYSTEEALDIMEHLERDTF